MQLAAMIEQFGDGSKTDRASFVQVAASRVIAIAVGGWHTIILKTDGSVQAAGSNVYGQLGDGSNADSAIFLQLTAMSLGNLEMEARPTALHVCRWLLEE